MKEELYVIVDGERKQLDLNTPSGITLNYRSNIFGDVSSMNNEHSYTFTLPYTQNNRMVFGCREDLRSEYKSRIYNAEFKLNGVAIFDNGELTIKKSSSLDGYEAAIVWGESVELKRLFDKDISLRELGKYIGIAPMSDIYGDNKVYDVIFDGHYQINPYYRKDWTFARMWMGGALYYPNLVERSEAGLNIPMRYFPEKPIGLTYDMRSSRALRMVYGAGFGLYEGAKTVIYNDSREILSLIDEETNFYADVYGDYARIGPYALGLMNSGLGLWDNMSEKLTLPIYAVPPLATPVTYLCDIIESVYGITIQLPELITHNFCLPFVRMGQPQTFMQQCWTRIYAPYDDRVGFHWYKGNTVYLFNGTEEEYNRFLSNNIIKKTFHYVPDDPFESRRDIEVSCDLMESLRDDGNGRIFMSGMRIGDGFGYNTFITGTMLIQIIFPRELWTNRAHRAIASMLKNPPKLVWKAISGEASTRVSGLNLDISDYSTTIEVEGTVLGYTGEHIDVYFDMRAASGHLVSISAFTPYNSDVTVFPTIDIGSIKVDNSKDENENVLDNTDIGVGVIDMDLYVYKGHSEELSVSENLSLAPEKVNLETPGFLGYFHNLPDISCKELLDTLCYAAGGFPYYNEKTREFSVKPWSELFTSLHSSVDWSKKLLLSKGAQSVMEYENQSLEEKLPNIARNIIFRMKNVDLDDEGNVVEPESDKDKYKESYVKVTIDNEEIENDYASIQVPFNAEFEAIATSPSVSTGGTFKFWESNAAADLELDSISSAYRYRKGFLMGLTAKEAEPILAKIDWQEVPDKRNWYYPMLKTWQFGDDDKEITSYADFLARVYEENRVIEEYMELSEFDLRDLDYTVPVYLDKYDAYFGIIEIERYDDGVCKVTMFALPNNSNKGRCDCVVAYSYNRQSEYDITETIVMSLFMQREYFHYGEEEPYATEYPAATQDNILVEFSGDIYENWEIVDGQLRLSVPEEFYTHTMPYNVSGTITPLCNDGSKGSPIGFNYSRNNQN